MQVQVLDNGDIQLTIPRDEVNTVNPQPSSTGKTAGCFRATVGTGVRVGARADDKRVATGEPGALEMRARINLEVSLKKASADDIKRARQRAENQKLAAAMLSGGLSPEAEDLVESIKA